MKIFFFFIFSIVFMSCAHKSYREPASQNSASECSQFTELTTSETTGNNRVIETDINRVVDYTGVGYGQGSIRFNRIVVSPSIVVTCKYLNVKKGTGNNGSQAQWKWEKSMTMFSLGFFNWHLWRRLQVRT